MPASAGKPRPCAARRAFYEIAVRPFLLRSNKVVVIISDALRYEVAEELLRLVRQEDRYDAEIEPLLAVLPSFTQLGMAALLPHQRWRWRRMRRCPGGWHAVPRAPSTARPFSTTPAAARPRPSRPRNCSPWAATRAAP